MAKPVTAVPWSHSSLSSFETCPRRHKILRVDKLVVEPQSDALTFGNKVHKELELAVKGEKGLSMGFTSYQPLVEKLRAAPGVKHTEQRFGLTQDFKPTTFFGKDVWVRGVLDLSIVQPKRASIIDYKTGKPKVDADQLRMFAGAAFSLYPHVEEVTTAYLWLGYNKMDREVFRREDMPPIWADFSSRVYRMEQAFEHDKFPPKPSGLCRQWCPVGKKHCEHCGT
jgi:CRISPR/Cas system-associated exonuclease Cas4 (RecB family)